MTHKNREGEKEVKYISERQCFHVFIHSSICGVKHKIAHMLCFGRMEG
jgi:hypothetical protein